jgi:hypothetical protein
MYTLSNAFNMMKRIVIHVFFRATEDNSLHGETVSLIDYLSIWYYELPKVYMFITHPGNKPIGSETI